MALTAQSPNPGDSNHVLLWKYAVNLHLLAIDAGVFDQSTPKLGSTDNALLSLALQSLLSVS